MRLLIGAGAAAALVLGPNVAAEASGSRATSAGWLTGDSDDKHNVDDVTSLRVLPGRPRQETDLRVITRCPKGSTDSVTFSKAFNDKGVRRHSTALGIGLNDDHFGHDTETVTFDAPLGPRRVWMKCVKVKVDKETRQRTVEVISRVRTAILVRKYVPWQI